MAASARRLQVALRVDLLVRPPSATGLLLADDVVDLTRDERTTRPLDLAQAHVAAQDARSQLLPVPSISALCTALVTV